MVIAVKSRPNHYEVLGLGPTATDEAIAQAFARQMRLPHPTAELAQIGIAFDTLRSPAKRRSYDEALGLRREPDPVPVRPAMSFRISARLAALASAGPIEPPPAAASSQRPGLPTDQPRSSERRAVAEPAVPRHVQRHHEQSEKSRAHLRPPVPQPHRQVQRGGPAARARPAIEDLFRFGETAGEAGADGWSRSGLTLGALLVAVVVIGAWAGAHAQDSDHGKAEMGLVASRPHPKPRPNPVPATAEVHDSGAVVWKPADSAARKPVRRRPLHSGAHASEARLDDISKSIAGAPADPLATGSATGQVSPAAGVGSAPAASLPLPKSVIARTIDRIGYPCGEVASSMAVEGSGAYKITCTSGRSYHAKPVQGRYHFRRW